MGTNAKDAGVVASGDSTSRYDENLTIAVENIEEFEPSCATNVSSDPVIGEHDELPGMEARQSSISMNSFDASCSRGRPGLASVDKNLSKSSGEEQSPNTTDIICSKTKLGLITVTADLETNKLPEESQQSPDLNDKAPDTSSLLRNFGLVPVKGKEDLTSKIPRKTLRSSDPKGHPQSVVKEAEGRANWLEKDNNHRNQNILLSAKVTCRVYQLLSPSTESSTLLVSFLSRQKSQNCSI